MEAWIMENWGKILLSLVTTGALTFCGWCWKQLKQYKKLLDEKEVQKMDDTIEEKIDEMLKSKKELADLAVYEGEKIITELSDEEIYEIFTLSTY